MKGTLGSDYDLRTVPRLRRRETASMKPSLLPQTLLTSEIFIKKESSKQRLASLRSSFVVLDGSPGVTVKSKTIKILSDW